jgi:hypothetical protein
MVAPYTALATSKTPAVIIYLLDVSASMEQMLGDRRRIDVVMGALNAALRQMVFRSTRGIRVLPRYRIAMLAYSNRVYDLLGGIRGIDHVVALGVPDLSTQHSTNTALAFATVEQLLRAELPNLVGCPAPLVCHLTDGEYMGDDPEPIVRRIMQLRVPDGNVLIENIFISDRLLPGPVTDSRHWRGIMPQTRFENDYANKLRAISSPLPGGYRIMMREMGYQMDDGALMMLPGTSADLVELGFVMSTSTPVR